MSIREECGVFGAMAAAPCGIADIVYYGLYALQHRGQESCGIVVNDDGLFASHKDLGLVGEVFSDGTLSRLPKGTMAVGHVRYGTTGASNRSNCQPIEVNHQKGRMALAHNGNLSNAAQLRNELELSGAIFHTTSDTETIAYLITRERLRAGRILARAHPVQADVVIGVPDSGLDAALGFSAESGIPYGIGLIKNKYIGRTFIAPGDRLDKVRIKLSAIGEAVAGKRVVLIDDSIVRGTTSGRIVRLLREAGAREIHLRISAPPFLHPCYYGTDIDSEDHLIASRFDIAGIAARLGADSLGYLPVDGLETLAKSRGICCACFSGEYPTPVPEDTRRDRFERRLSDRNR